MSQVKIFKLKYIVLFVLVAGAFSFGLLWQVHNSGTHQGHGEVQTDEKKVANKKMYVCPMHPQITSDQPGQSCSICGMSLVAVEDEEEHSGHDEHSGHEEHSGHGDHAKGEGDKNQLEKLSDHSQIKLSKNKQQLIGVKIGQVTKQKLFKTINAPGRIAFDPELYTVQSEYLEALRQWKNIKNSPLVDVRRNTQEMVRSAKIRLKVLGLSESQIQLLTKKGTQSEGLLVSGKGQENWVYADVFEVDLPQIKKGLSAEISANFLQGKTLAGKVISVDQVINPETRTAKVRIQLQGSDSSIRPESYVNVKIFTPQGEHLAVPIEALLDTGRDTFVFVKKEKGHFDPQRVTVLLETDEQVAIGSGLKENDEVVIGGNFMLDSESRLKSVLSGARSSNGHSH